MKRIPFIFLLLLSTFYFSCFFVRFSSSKPPPGALIAVWFDSTVGVMLDDYPINEGLRDMAAAFYLNQDISFWKKKATLQTRMTLLRQVMRRYYKKNKAQLTLPPMQRWVFLSNNTARRTTIDNHDYVSWDYSFVSVLVTREDDIINSEPALTTIGGRWSDMWTLPVEPEFLKQKTAYACLDSLNFEPGAVFSENTWFYYDDTLSKCETTLRQAIGAVEVDITWERIPWNDQQANIWRFGEQTSKGADLIGVRENLEESISLEYRYFPPTSCALSDVDPRLGSCISAPGWRRILKFTSSQKNIGHVDLVLGAVDNPALQAAHLFKYDPCHHHFHFQHYAEFQYRDTPGRKTGFCLQTTWRYHNNEYTRLATPFDNCGYQGISIGWGDDYVTGLDCQWVDVTGVAPGTGNLTEILNPDDFICEGVPIKNHGQLTFVNTSFLQDGMVVQRVNCDFTPGYKSNNIDTASFYLPANVSMVTMPCSSPLGGPFRNCGFSILSNFVPCDKTQKVGLTVQSPQAIVLRICETTYKLGKISTSCDLESSVANFLVDYPDVLLNFKCPDARDAEEPGGAFSILVAPLLPNASLPIVQFQIE